MKKTLAGTFAVFILMLSACQPPLDPMKVEVLSLKDQQQKQSYALGASLGQISKDQMATQQQYLIEYDKAIVVKGFIAALQGQSQLDKEQVLAMTRAIETQVREQKQLLKSQKGEINQAEGKEFLAINAKREGIIETASGLQYEVLRQGKGAKPNAFDTVKVHYQGTLLNGTEFDSSYARKEPATFPLNRVIRGWTEGLQLMSVGAKYKFYVPADLAYGARNTGKIGSYSTLIFEVELLDITNKTQPAVK
jgi:FKBP-type peptidyl-prolyl cis-trans isomerase FkpA